MFLDWSEAEKSSATSSPGSPVASVGNRSRMGTVTVAPPPGCAGGPLVFAAGESPAAVAGKRISSLQPAASAAPAPVAAPSPGVVDVCIPFEVEAAKTRAADALRLWNADGTYDRTLNAKDPAVEQSPTGPLLLYRFSEVPAGEYTIDLKAGDTWLTMAAGVRIRVDAAPEIEGGASHPPPEASSLGVPNDGHPEALETAEEPGQHRDAGWTLPPPGVDIVQEVGP